MELFLLYRRLGVVAYGTRGERGKVIPQSDIPSGVVAEVVEFLRLLVQEVVLCKVVEFEVEGNVALSLVEPSELRYLRITVHILGVVYSWCHR